MSFPKTRLRRLRSKDSLRSLVQEVRLSPSDFIAPLFVVPGSGLRREIESMPGQFHFSVDRLVEECRELVALGINSVILFGIPEQKDETGEIACHPDGVVQQAIRELKQELPELLLIADLCFCEYTTHGHCGVMQGDRLNNDATLEMLSKQAISLAKSGADLLAPSGMIDGMVGALRHQLDESGYSYVSIMSYSAKYASAWYGPFREAVNSTPEYGDRKTYQMNYANRGEAIREVEEDILEGADIVMIKPAMSFLDVVYSIKQRVNIPLAVYNVSGEYSMIKLAAKQGLVDGEALMEETLLSMKRAGADLIVSYFAKEMALKLQK